MKYIVKKFNELTTKELYEILKSRFEIFVCEQKITSVNEIDRIDYNSYHAFIIDNDEVIAYLRFFHDDINIVIGRVLTLHHNKGVGKILMNETIDYIRKNLTYKQIILHSQLQVVKFYEKLGFKIISNEYMEAGIIHVTMALK